MVVLAQALVSQPKYILIDELSLGLAPVIVNQLIPVIRSVAASGVGVLLIEQFATVALALATGAHVMEGGVLRYSGTASRAEGATRSCCTPPTCCAAVPRRRRPVRQGRLRCPRRPRPRPSAERLLRARPLHRALPVAGGSYTFQGIATMRPGVGGGRWESQDGRSTACGCST